MMIQIGEQLPDGRLFETTEFNSAGTCPLNPQPVEVLSAAAGKTVAIFAVPGAFTPTCSERHLPGFIAHADALKAKGVDEIWCVATNDAFVMAAWGQSVGATGVVRMLGDGNADWTRALGLTMDASAGGMGTRSRRYSMLVKDATVTQLNVEPGRTFDVSNVETLLAQMP